MRKLMRGVIIILISCCMLLTGCSKAAEPDEMAQILYDFYVKEDMANIEALELSQEAAAKLIDNGITNFETELEESLRSIAGEYQIQINKEDIEATIAARREIEKKLTSEVELISKESNTAKIKLDTTYFKEDEIYKAASNALEKRMSDVALDDEETFVQQCIDIYIEEIIKAYETAPISSDKKTIEADFTKQNSIWLPTDQQAFINHLTALTSGYEVE